MVACLPAEHLADDRAFGLAMQARNMEEAEVRRARAVSEMDLDRPIEIVHRSQELDELVSSFNVMRERVKTMTQTLEVAPRG